MTRNPASSDLSPPPPTSEEDLDTIERMRSLVIRNGELRFLSPTAAHLIDKEIPGLIQRLRELSRRYG